MIILGGLIDLSRCALHPSITLGGAASADGAPAPSDGTRRTSRALRTGRAYMPSRALHRGGGGFFQPGSGQVLQNGSKGLMPQDLKPLSMFWGVTTSTKAFAHNSTNEAGLAALPLHSLCRSFSKCVKARFKALKTVRFSGCMTSVKWVGRTTISTPSSLHSIILDRVMWVFSRLRSTLHSHTHSVSGAPMLQTLLSPTP